MRYIILIAGKGNRLHPLTLQMPKSLYKLEASTTILERMISIIKKNDKEAKFTIVVGFKAEEIKERIGEKDYIEFVENPFYSVTNSIASLWFARDYLEGNVTIINGDIVMEETIISEIVCHPVKKACVLLDSSIKSHGDYNVEVLGKRVLVMSKDLDEYFGEYAGITKLDSESCLLLKRQVDLMVKSNMYDQWYENALVQMIFDNDFELEYIDICNYKWTEVDCVNDMLMAKTIHRQDKNE